MTSSSEPQEPEGREAPPELLGGVPSSARYLGYTIARHQLPGAPPMALELHTIVDGQELIHCWLSVRAGDGTPVVLARGAPERAMRRPPEAGEE